MKHQPLVKVEFPVVGTYDHLMKPRWISVVPDCDETTLGLAVIASWWPGKYYQLCTMNVAAFENDAVNAFLGKKVTSGFQTSVFKATSDGLPKDMSLNSPLYQAEHRTKENALEDHERILSLMKNGIFDFKK